MNKISVVGRVSTDVEIRDANGRNVANFNVAAQNKQKVGEENGRPLYGTNFYHCSAWGPAADTASRFLKKGHRVGIVGDLIIREYTGNDGTKKLAVDINNCEIDLIETKSEAEAKANAAPAPACAAAHAPAPAPVAGMPASSVVDNDELPFDSGLAYP